MIKVNHRFSNHKIDHQTETMIIGTFNPETAENDADFFYGRSRNFFWRLLPIAYGEADLKRSTRQEKINFIQKYNIGLIDLIEEVQVEDGQEANYYDRYIDRKVTRWKDIVGIMKNLPNLKKVCFTRRISSDIPSMRTQLEPIRQYCEKNGIPFISLTTPARYYNEHKQAEWTQVFSNDTR